MQLFLQDTNLGKGDKGKMPARTLAEESAAGSLSKGKTVARRSTGSMLRTSSGAKGSGVAKRSPGGAIGTICRAKGSNVARKAAAGAGLRTLSQARGSKVARKAVAGSTRTYRAKFTVAKGTVVTRALEPAVIEKVSPAELPGYQGQIYRGKRKRSIAVTGMGNIPLLCAAGPMYMPPLARPGSYPKKEYLELERK